MHPNTRSLHGTCEMTTAPVGGPEVEGGRGPRTDPATVRRHASRRFEAVVLVGDEVVGAAGAADDIAGLCAAGAAVAVIAPSPLAQLTKRLPSNVGPGVVLLAGASGTERARVGAGGVVRLPHSFTERDERALARARSLVVERLDELGVSAAARPQPGRWRVAAGLAVPADLEGSEVAVHQWMLGHGLAGRRALLDLAVTAAREAGLAEPRVHIFKSAVRWIMDARWEGGVGPRSTLLAVDEQHGFDGLGPANDPRGDRRD